MVGGKQGPLGFTPKRIVADRFMPMLCLQAQHLFGLADCGLLLACHFFCVPEKKVNVRSYRCIKRSACLNG